MSSSPTRIRADSPITRDSVGGFRFAGGVVALTALAAAVGALLEPSLRGRRRALIAAASGAVAVAAIEGARTPKRAAKLIVEHPTLTLIAGGVPVLAAPAFGRRFNAIHMLSITGTAVSAAVLEPKRHRWVAAVAGGYWIAQSAAHTRSWSELRSDEKLSMNFVIVPLAFWAVSRITPDVLTAVREFGQLESKLEQATRQLEGLRVYRTRLERGLDVVQDALEAAAPAVETVQSDNRELARSTLLRAVGRLDERAAVLDVASRRISGVESLLLARAGAWQRIEPTVKIAQDSDAAPQIEVIAEPGTTVTNARVLALIGSATTAALSNAMRHARPTRISITLRAIPGDRVELRVDNDGLLVNGAQPDRLLAGSGLGHLRWQAEGLDGGLEWGPKGNGGWSQRLELPAGPVVSRGSGLISERMIVLLDNALTTSTRICAGMVGVMAAEARQLPDRGLRRTQALTALTLLGYELLEHGGKLRNAPTGERPSPWWAAGYLSAAAVVSTLSPHYEHSLWSGWANSALSRYGLRATPRSLTILIGAHVAAIALSYRGGWRDALVMASHQMTLPLLGPASFVAAVSKALAALDANERSLQQSFTEISQLHDLAESFHTAHPVTDPLLELEAALVHDPETVGALEAARNALTDAARALPPGQNASAFANEFARVLAARLWPAEIILTRDDDLLAQLDADASLAVEFRGPALEVADRLGDQLASNFPPDWLARPQLHSVHLRITAQPHTDTILVLAIPQSPIASPPRTADALGDALARAGGTLKEGYADGRIRLNLQLKRYSSGHHA